MCGVFSFIGRQETAVKRTSLLWLVIAIALNGGVPVLAHAAQRYVFTDLGKAAGNSDSRAVRINNLGQVIVRTNGEQRSFVWIPNKPNGTNGRFWDLGLVPPKDYYPEFGTQTIALGINDKGEVVGISGSARYYKNASCSEPFKTRVGKKLDLSCVLTDKDGGTTPYAINNHGVVVGALEAATTSHAAKWFSDGRGVSLGKLHKGDFECAAYGINDHGTIVGMSNEHAWVLDGMHKRDLGPGTANSINNRGIVAGTSGDDRACIWVGGKRQLLDRTHYRTLSGSNRFSSKGSSVAADINDAGQVVGSLSVYIPASRSQREHYEDRAVLWSGGKTINLNEISGIPPGWTLKCALANNNKGQIVGVGESAARPDRARAFLLTPLRASRLR